MQVMNRAAAIEYVLDRDELFDAQENPFSRSAWLVHFLVEVAQDNWTIFVVESIVGDGAVMLLYEAPGVPRQALTNYYASLFTPVVASADDRARSAHLMVQKLASRRPVAPTMRFSPLSTRDADMMGDAWRMQGWYVKRFFCFGNWYLPCAGLSFEAYMADRGTKLKRANKFVAAGANRVEIVTDPSQVEAAMDVYDAVFLKRWARHEPHPQFVRGWARICAEQGWLRLGIAWAGDVPVAAQFWFVIDGRAFIFKVAYDEDHAKLSAGTILTVHMFKHVLDTDRVGEVDYLTGDDEYKKSWMTHRRERVGLIVCNTRTMRGLGRAVVEAAGSLRRTLRNGREAMART